MKRLFSLLSVAAFSISLVAAPPAKPALDSDLKLLEDSFNASADRVERDARRLKVQAADKRLESYRTALKSATKAGDFDKATRIKARIVELEAMQPGERAVRPKETAKFKGHSYALIRDPNTWHVSKRKCEEMGGHLACLETPAEAEFVARMCSNSTVWVGATDEDVEGQWKWINGAPFSFPPNTGIDNTNNSEHTLTWSGHNWNDLHSSARMWFICEWE